ncbi:MAG: hypothetical protein PVH30_13925 [Desulfobacterales bacterium]
MRTSVTVSIALIVALIGAWMTATPCAAQDASENMKIVKEKVLADRKFFVAANMELTDEEGKAFWPLYDQYVADQAALAARGGGIIEDFAKNYQSMTDEKAKALLDDYMAFESDRLKLQQEYLPKFRKAIPEKKVTRYYQLENKIRAIGQYELASKIPLMK